MGRSFSVLRGIFVALIVTSTSLVVTGVLTAFSYQSHLQDGAQESYDLYTSIVSLDDFFTILSIIPLVAGFVALIVWTRRAFIVSENAPITQSTRRYSRGMAVGSWFIPFGNLFVPKKVISEVERALTVGAEDQLRAGEWSQRPVKQSGTWWWALWVFSMFIDRALMNSLKQTDADGYLTTSAVFQSAWLSAASNAVTVASLVLGIGYLGYVTRLAEGNLARQRSKLAQGV
jgi:Domain of unknown function (DUF4328)